DSARERHRVILASATGHGAITDGWIFPQRADSEPNRNVANYLSRFLTERPFGQHDRVAGPVMYILHARSRSETKHSPRCSVSRVIAHFRYPVASTEVVVGPASVVAVPSIMNRHWSLVGRTDERI